MKSKSYVAKPSKTITKEKLFSYKRGGKNITVSHYDSKGNIVHRYIPNTKVNRDAILKLRGKADIYDKRANRLIWF